MTSRLSTDTLIEDNVRRSADSFSFTDTAASFIGNRNFLEGYRHFKLGQHDNKSYIWEALSAIGDSTAEVIYSNVINFVDNASNVDLCKVPALQSILSGFGLQYNIIDNYSYLPLEVQQLVDVLSINKKYLLNSKVIKQSLVDDLSANVLSASTSTIIDDDKYASYLSTLFRSLIDSIVNSTYVEELSSVKVYQKISDQLVYDNTETAIDAQSTIEKLKKKYGLGSFDQEAIADAINNGSDDIESYSGTRKTIIELELSSRATAKYSAYPETRYAYYKEEKVKTYFEFLKNKYFSENSNVSSSTQYSVDPNYYVYDALPSIQFIKYVDSSHEEDERLSAYIGKYVLTDRSFVDDGCYSYADVLDLVAASLGIMTRAIAEIREKAKLSLQRSYMKGTFNLLSYVVNEYLIEYASSNPAIKKSTKAYDMMKKHVQDDIELVEYYDTTEYFNLSTDTTPYAQRKKLVNDRFWEESTTRADANSNFAFAEDEIEQYYLSTLNMQSKLQEKKSSLMSFLSTVYAAGANKSYVNSSGSKVISTVSSLYADSADMFNRFYGADGIGNIPYYNHKNLTHASYQVHPYLYRFVETSQYDESIANAFFNDINQQLEDTQVLAQLDDYVGKYGEVINVALNNSYDYSGYRTRYETSNHEISLGARGHKSMVIDYDGAFYPPAAKEFYADPDACIQSLSVDTSTHSSNGEDESFYEKYYKHLNLTSAQRKHIASQLNEYKDTIMSIIEDKANLSSVYDIYKYARDAYDNSYILYKRYSSASQSVKEKRDAKGELWIRLNNHPIAFPAFAGTQPQVDCTTEEKYNNLLDLILRSKVGKLPYNVEPARYFYDLELDRTKRYAVLPYYPKNHPSLSAFCFDGSDCWQNAQFLACSISEEYNTITEYTALQLNSNRSTKFEGYINSDVVKAPNSDGYAFLGFFKADKDLGLAFAKKHVDNSLAESLPDSNYIDVRAVRLDTASYTQSYVSGVLKPLDGMQFASSDIAFSYYSDKLAYAIPMEFISEGQLSVQNYIGTAGGEGIGVADYSSSTLGETIDAAADEMNSFDRLDSFIGIVEAVAGYSDIRQDSDAVIYNLNADPSYIPAYSGKAGKTDFTKSSYYEASGKSYRNVELLGWSKDIDADIAKVDAMSNGDYSYDDLFSQLWALASGRVYEHYKADDDMSFKILQSPHLSSAADDSDIVWRIDAFSDSSYIESHLNSLRVILYKSTTYGKNPYYDGPLSALTCETALYYTDKSSASEVSANGVAIAGTYDVYSKAINTSESNVLHGVRAISACFEGKILTVKFAKSDRSKESWIGYHDINAIIIDDHDFRIYEQYHLFDRNAFLSGNVVYDASGIAHDGRIYDGVFKTALSAHPLSSYSELSSIPYLSGNSTLAFKNSEEDIWQLSSPLFYFPGDNECFPSRMSDLYAKYAFGTSYTADQMAEVFNSTNLFVVQCTPSNTLTSYGAVYIPMMYFSTYAVRAYESLLSGDAVYDYDVVDPHFFKYVKFSGENMPCSGETSIDLGRSFPIEFNDETLVSAYNSICRKCGCSAVGIEDGAFESNETYVEFDTTELSGYTDDDLSKYFNIYVNYKKNNDKTLTLYFNYVNYLNTPYIQKKYTGFKSHIINGTYLKLGPGENGKLDIIIQLKYIINETDIGGYKNIVVASYQIYNLSDDKPKFLITKL